MWNVGSNQQSRRRQPRSQCGASACISSITRARVDVGRAEQFQRPRGAAPFRERRAFDHHRAGIGARHPQVRRVGAGIDPGALAERPAEARRGVGLPALHLDDAILDVELERLDEPRAQLAEREPVAHRQRPGADEALPAGAQRQAFDRPADGIGPVQHPHRFAVFRRRFEHVAQRGDEGVDAAAEILQIDEQDIERVHHRVGRPAHFAVQAEHRDAVHRIVEVRRLDHVVLLVAAQAVLRAEGGGELDVAAGGERIERMRQVCGHRGRMRQQRHAPAGERRAQRGFGEQPVDAELHHLAKPEFSDTNSADQAYLCSLRPLWGRDGEEVGWITRFPRRIAARMCVRPRGHRR